MHEIIETARARKHDNNSIRAELIGVDTCICCGVMARSTTPVLTLCRKLIAAGLDPDTALAVYRGATLALKVSSIGEAAGLTIRDDNRGVPRLVAYRPGPTERGRVACGEAPPIEFPGAGRTEVADSDEWQPWLAEMS